MSFNSKNKIVLLTTALLSAGALIGCGGGGGKYDTTYNVSIWNFAGGFGQEWITNAISEYETLHKDTKYGDKTGVHFEVLNNKKLFEASELIGYDMFFLESANYMDFVACNAVEDITEAVTGANPYESGKTILDKFTESQKSFYNTKNGKYFGIPHYSGTYGLTYDAKLFRTNGYYFKKGHETVPANPDNVLKYFTNDLNNLAPGPDGKTGTIDGVDYSADDGLPATFNEFYALCERIKLDTLSPLDFAGDTNKGGYITSFASSLMNALMGEEQANLNYNFEGTLNKVVKMTDSGGKSSVVTDVNGDAVLEAAELEINSDNGYESFKSQARFDTVKFISNIFENKRYNPHCDSDGHTYTNAQSEYIMGEKDGNNKTVYQSAMLIDGSWWESEAKDTFASQAATYPGEEQSMMERDFRFMPLPKAREEDEYHQTYTDTLNALQCVRSGVSEQTKAICIDFLQFINTDEQLVKFSKTTQTTRALQYSMSEADLEALSPYGRSLFAYKNHPDTEIIYPISGNAKFINGMSAYFSQSLDFSSENRKYITNWFESGIYDPSQIVGGIYDYYKEAWSRI